MASATAPRRARQWPARCGRSWALLLAAGSFASQLRFSGFAVGGTSSNGRQSARGEARIPRAADSSQDDAWREAYATELDRHRLLREQLRSCGGEAAGDVAAASEYSALPGIGSELDDACDVDWATSYESLVACNGALTERLRSAQESAEGPAGAPLVFQVDLPQMEERQALELMPYFGRRSAFYLVRARLPLGLQLAKEDQGDLQGAFLVENIVQGGSAEASGRILPGDVLQGLTVAAEGEDRSGWTDIVSSFVGGLEGGSLRQTLIDATFVPTLEDLLDKIQGHRDLGEEVELTLIFERDVSKSPAPVEPLQPLLGDAGDALKRNPLDGLLSPTRSTDIA